MIEQEEQSIELDEEAALEDDETEVSGATEAEIPLGIVLARIIVVSGIGIAAALAIFFLVGAIWIPAMIALVITVVFLGLMFGVEKLAE